MQAHPVGIRKRFQTTNPTYNGTIRSATSNVETGSHVGTSDGFYLLHTPKGRIGQELIKVAYYLIQ